MSTSSESVHYGLVFECTAAEVRKLVRKANRVVRTFSETFDLRNVATKRGVRLLENNDDGDTELDMEFDAQTKKFKMEMRIKKSSDGHSGKLITLLGLYLHLVETSSDLPKLTHTHTNIPDMKITRQWGEWAFKKITKANPSAFE